MPAERLRIGLTDSQFYASQYCYTIQGQVCIQLVWVQAIAYRKPQLGNGAGGRLEAFGSHTAWFPLVAQHLPSRLDTAFSPRGL